MLLRCVDGERLRLVGLFVAAAAVRVPGASVYGELKEKGCVQEMCSVVLVLFLQESTHRLHIVESDVVATPADRSILIRREGEHFWLVVELIVIGVGNGVRVASIGSRRLSASSVGQLFVEERNALHDEHEEGGELHKLQLAREHLVGDEVVLDEVIVGLEKRRAGERVARARREREHARAPYGLVLAALAQHEPVDLEERTLQLLAHQRRRPLAHALAQLRRRQRQRQ